MTEPVQNQHHGIASEPALKASNGSDRPPYGKQVNPVWFVSFVHAILHMLASKHKRSRLATDLCELSWNGKEVVEAPRYERKGLGFASCFNRAGLKLASNETDVPHLSFRNNPLTKLPVRVSALPQRRHVSGGTSPSDRASDPSKRRTRLWTQLAALYGAYGLCETDAINRLTGRLVLDNGHGKVNGDLILCSPTAWYSLGTGNCGRRTIAQGMAHG